MLCRAVLQYRWPVRPFSKLIRWAIDLYQDATGATVVSGVLGSEQVPPPGRR